MSVIKDMAGGMGSRLVGFSYERHARLLSLGIS